jgi:hypothetical protein
VGSGFKTFTAGSVLTASDVQNYLQDQAVMVFGGTAARSSAIGTANFEEGMLTYLTDVDKLQVYTGSSFQDVYPPAATSQGMTLINTTSFSGVSSVSAPASTFTSTYDSYKIICDVTAVSASTDWFMRLRKTGTDSITGYLYALLGFSAAGGTFNFTNTTGTFFKMGEFNSGGNEHYYSVSMDLYRPFLSTRTTLTMSAISLTSGLQVLMNTGSGLHNVVDTYDSITFAPSSGTFSGKIQVFGYNL